MKLDKIAADVKACAESWEPGVRLIGNVTAAQLLELVEEFMNIKNERDLYKYRFQQSDEDRTRLGTNNILLRQERDTAQQIAKDAAISYGEGVKAGGVQEREACAQTVLALADQIPQTGSELMAGQAMMIVKAVSAIQARGEDK